MDMTQHEGIGVFEFADVVVTAIGVRFSLDADFLPVVDDDDRQTIAAIRRQAREQGLKACETVFSGRTLPIDPWKFRIHRSRELGLAYDVHEPGRPPRLGLQSPDYREYWRHELRLLNERDEPKDQSVRTPDSPDSLAWIETLGKSERHALLVLLLNMGARKSVPLALDKHNTELLERTMRRLNLRVDNPNMHELNSYFRRILARLNQESKAAMAESQVS